MKDEIESMRDNLRALVREKEDGMKEYTSLQKDLAKITNDRQLLEEQVQDEMHRADKLTKERSSLQGKVDEMRKDLNKRDLVAAADKKTINTYADEIKNLKDEKGNVVKEAEKLRKQSKNLLHDMEKMNRVEILRNENALLLQKVDQFDKMRDDLDSVQDDLEYMNRLKEDLKALKIKTENSQKEIEILRNKNELLLHKVDEFDQIQEDIHKLQDEKVLGLREMDILKDENEALLENSGQ
ncbi:hypothetical protein OS493_026220 [Desmophyllum pertusum]|uniref:Uncharacterized protein n=1 Tax=Desmophyllum pertusum TaxID=174260 RepID=A0A9W9ZLP4_9CNID|nr:hypothetical protein OS493_026220 [Desmophyllum pertusum]